MEFVDIGGGGNKLYGADDDEAGALEVPSFPLRDMSKTMSLCLQQGDITSLSSKRRKGKGDVDLKDLYTTYNSILLQDFALDSTRTAWSKGKMWRQSAGNTSMPRTSVLVAPA